MLLPTTAEYALRAMAHLACLPEGRAVRAQEIAAETEVPVAYLSKILRKLVVAGLLTSQKGHGGGFALAYPPGEISFAEVLEAVDFGADTEHCAFGWKACDPGNPCPLHPALSEFKASFLRWAAETTFEGICIADD